MSDIDAVQADVRDADAVARACVGVDVVWHLAAINGTRFFYERPDAVLDVGIRGMLNVLDGAIRADVSGFLLASSSEVYASPPSTPTSEDVPLVVPDVLNPRYSYAGSKLVSEQLLIHNAARFERAIVFRPHNVYGPDMGWEHVIPQLAVRVARLRLANEVLRLPIQGSGSETRAFAYVDDVVEGLRIILDRGASLGLYHVGTDVETTIAELAGSIGRHLGTVVQVVAGPARTGGTHRRCPDISRLRALGYSPTVGLADGLARTLPWYLAHIDEAPTDELPVPQA